MLLYSIFNHNLFSLDQNSNVETRQCDRTNRKLTVRELTYLRFFDEEIVLSSTTVEHLYSLLNSEME